MKKVVFALICWEMTVWVTPCQAGIKFDFTNTANKVQGTVTEWAGQAQKLIEESTTFQTMQALGKGAIEAKKQMDAQINMVKDTVNQATGTVTGAVNNVTGAVSDIQNTATSTVGSVSGEISGTVGDVAGSASGAVGDVAGGVAGNTQSAQQLLSLKNEKASLESEYNTAAEARKTEYEGKVKSYQDNNAVYQQQIAQDPSQKDALESQIAANNEAIQKLQADYEANEEKERASYQTRVANIDQQIATLQEAAAQESLSLAKDGLGAAKSLFGDKNQSAEALNKTIANNFVPEKAQLTSDNMKKVENYRQRTKAEDILYAYALAQKIRAERGSNIEKADETASSVPMMDGSSAAIVMDTQLKVQNMKVLLDYTKLLIQEMKIKSASDLANMKAGKLNNPNKAVTQFNLDDYEYEKPSFFSKDNLTDMADKAKSGLSTAKEGLSATQSAVGEAKAIMNSQSGGNSSTEDINQDKSDDLWSENSLSDDEQETTQTSPQTNFPYNLTLGEIETLESLKGTDVTETLVVMNMNGVSKEDALRIIQSGATQDDVEMLKNSGIDTSYVDQIAKGEMVSVVKHAQGLMEKKQELEQTIQKQEQRIQELEQQRSSVLEKLKQEKKND